jgi:hypothetical protein
MYNALAYEAQKLVLQERLANAPVPPPPRRSPSRGARRTVAAALVALVAGALGAGPARAAGSVYYVSSSAPSDPACASASPTNPFASIAGALACAANGSTIQISAGTFAGGFTIAHNVRLIGSGPATVIAGPSAPLKSITEVTVAGGRSVTLQSLTVDGQGSQKDVSAGSGSLNVVDSTITGGLSSIGSPGIDVSPATGISKLTVLRSTIANNLGLGGKAGGGGIYVAGITAGSATGSASVIDSTIADNHGGEGGGIAIGPSVSLNVRDSTISGNDAGAAGGLYVAQSASPAPSITVTNTILAANTGSAGVDCEVSGVITDGGHNVLGVAGNYCQGIVDGRNGDQAGTVASPLDPHLGQLADNGGPTQTLALLSGSPAINAGDATDCQAAPVNSIDQRRHSRRLAPRLACDTGAYDTGGQPLQTLYVKATASADPDCASASQTNPFATIAGALACASDGATVSVGVGTFAGGFTIAHNIVLQGSGAGTVIADPSAPHSGLTEVTIANEHFVTLRNLTVNGSTWQRNVLAGIGSLTVVNSTITGGVSAKAGGIGVAPGAGTATLTVLRSTIANNLGLADGAGGIGIADGIDSSTVNSVNVVDSTITGNNANFSGGGIRIGRFVALTVRDSTIAGNNADQTGGGLWVTSDGTGTLSAPITLTNTILASNTAASSGQDCQAQGITDGGHNLLGVADANCQGIVAGSHASQAGTAASPLDPHLGQLAANGGPTKTLALLTGSPAINAADAANCQAAPASGTDQRGQNRNVVGRDTCDIGAYDTGGH